MAEQSVQGRIHSVFWKAIPYPDQHPKRALKILPKPDI
jgi:hypothetical protein